MMMINITYPNNQYPDSRTLRGFLWCHSIEADQRKGAESLMHHLVSYHFIKK